MANSLVFPQFKLRQMGNNGTPVDLDADTIKLILVNATFAALSDAAKRALEFYGEVDSPDGEVAASGTYSAGGVTLGSKTSSQSAGVYTFDAADPSAFTGATIAAAGAVIYKDTGTPATSPLIAYLDFGGTITSTNGSFQVTFNASGIFSY